jgi:glycosyltransferase involved in cell wall biosynthesis
LRILYATDSYHPKNDGVVRYIDETSRLLSEDHEVGVLAPTFRVEDPSLDPEWVNVHRLRSIDLDVHGYGFTFPAYGEAKKVVLNYDLVFLHSIAPLGSIALFAAKHNRKPLAAFLHCIESVSMGAAFRSLFMPWRRAMDFYSQRLYMRCDSLILESRTVGQELERLGIREYSRLLFGIDHQRFRPDRESQFDFGLPDDRPVVVFAGRLSYQKGVDILVEIIKGLRDEVHFLVVGDGPQRRYVEELDAKNLTYVGGFLENIEDAFSASDIFLFIGNEYRRDLTMICYEALASGLPVVAPDFGYDSVLADGHNCVLRNRTPISLSEGIRELLLDSKMVEMSHNAARSVEELTWPNHVHQLTGILERTEREFKRIA